MLWTMSSRNHAFIIILIIIYVETAFAPAKFVTESSTIKAFTIFFFATRSFTLAPNDFWNFLQFFSFLRFFNCFFSLRFKLWLIFAFNALALIAAIALIIRQTFAIKFYTFGLFAHAANLNCTLLNNSLCDLLFYFRVFNLLWYLLLLILHC